MPIVPIETIDCGNFEVIYINISNIDNKQAQIIKEDILKKGIKSTKIIGLIFFAESLFTTPTIRQLGKDLSLELQKTNRYIGGVIYGVNQFNKMVARLASKKVQFADSKTESLEVIQEMFDRKRPNYLPETSKKHYKASNHN